MGSLFFVSFFALLGGSFGHSQYCSCGNYENSSSGGFYHVIPQSKDTAVQALLRRASFFSDKFIKEIGKTVPYNMASSPFGISASLSPEWYTSEGHWTLIDSLFQNDRKVDVRLANQVFYPCDFCHAHCHALSSSGVKFQGAQCGSQAANEWYKKQMGDVFTSSIKSDYFNKQTGGGVLVSAAHLRGHWAQRFYSTTIEFHRPLYTTQALAAIRTTNTYNYGKLPRLFNATFIEIPYTDPRYSMVVLLPWSYRQDGLSRVENNMDKMVIKQVLSSGRPTTVDFFAPKFNIHTEVDLKQTLERLDTTVGIHGGPSWVSKVIHKVVMGVNELGTNVPAPYSGTAAPWKKPYFFTKPATFRADHPFLALIVAKHNNNPFILFAARYLG